MRAGKMRRSNHHYIHWCPACERGHAIQVGAASGPNWSFDGDVNRPTFSPSVLIRYNGADADTRRDDAGRAPSAVCHYFLTGGVINYLGDCSHELRGTSVELSEFPEDYGVVE